MMLFYTSTLYQSRNDVGLYVDVERLQSRTFSGGQLKL